MYTSIEDKAEAGSESEEEPNHNFYNKVWMSLQCCLLF